MVIDFSRLAKAVEDVRDEVARVADAAENPTWAAGDEMCRRAATALRHGWNDDALADAETSINAYRYRAAPHLIAGLALLNLGKAVDAFDALQAAIKYGAAAEPEHAATAALIAAQMADGAGAPERALSVLTAGREATDDLCPALTAQVLRRTSDPADRRQLWHQAWIDPSIAVRFVEDDRDAFPDVDEVLSAHAALRRVAADLLQDTRQWLERLLTVTPKSSSGSRVRKVLNLQYAEWNYGEQPFYCPVPWAWYVDQNHTRDAEGRNRAYAHGPTFSRNDNAAAANAKARKDFDRSPTSKLLAELNDSLRPLAGLGEVLEQGDQLSYCTGRLVGTDDAFRASLQKVLLELRAHVGDPGDWPQFRRHERKRRQEEQLADQASDLRALESLEAETPKTATAAEARQRWRALAPAGGPQALVRPYVDLPLSRSI